MPLQLRRGTDLQRQNMTEPLAAGELIYITDTGELYIGDGTTAGGNPIAQYTTATIKGLAAGVLTGGAHSGISFTYDSVSGTVDAVVDPDLSNYQGVIRASAFNGTLVADDSTVLVDAVDGKIELDGTVKGDIVPDLNQVYDIGSSTNRFKDIYLSGSSIFLGNATITATGTAVNLPAGSTINGIPIGTGSGVGDGVLEGSTYKINIAGDDSTIIVDATAETVTAQGGFYGDLVGDVTGTLFGNVTGDLTGQVFGNVTGNVTGNLTGNVTGDVTGNLTGNVTGNVTGDLDGNVVGFLIGDVFGNVTGNVEGNVTGNVTGNLTGSVNGDLKGSVFADDSSALVDAISKIFYGVLDTGNIVLNSSSITADDGNINIGTAASPLTVSFNLDNNIQVRQVTDGSNPVGYVTTTTSRGTHSAPQALQPGDELGGLLLRGYTDSSTAGIGGIISFFVDPTASISNTGYIKSIVAISASSDTDQTESEAFVLDSTGTASSNVFSANKFFQLPVYADDAARLAAIPSPAKGMMIFIEAGTAPAATNQMQVFDGTNWVNAS